MQVHVSEHHESAHEQGGGVGAVQAGDIRGGTVDGLSEHAVVAHIARRGEAEAADEAGAQVRDNVAVEVGHDHDVEQGRVGHKERGGVVDEQSLELNLSVVAVGDLLGALEEEPV